MFLDFSRVNVNPREVSQFFDLRRQFLRCQIERLQVSLVAGDDETALTRFCVLYNRFQFLKTSDSITAQLFSEVRLENAVSKPKRDEHRDGDDCARNEQKL